MSGRTASIWSAVGGVGLLALLARETYVHAVARRVLLDAGVVEHLRESRQTLPDRLALAAGRVQCRDDVGHVGGRDLVDTFSSEQREDAPELDAVPDRRSLRDVHPGRAPALGGLRERRRRVDRLCELAEAWDAHRRELSGNPLAPS
jgi:hypothetical protein